MRPSGESVVGEIMIEVEASENPDVLRSVIINAVSMTSSTNITCSSHLNVWTIDLTLYMLTWSIVSTDMLGIGPLVGPSVPGMCRMVLGWTA